MLRVAVFTVVFLSAVISVLFYHVYSIAIIGSLYLVLVLQAERAAKLEMLRVASLYPKDEETPLEQEEIPVAPLGEKKVFTPSYEEPTLVPEVPRKKLPRAPSFQGRAHEILGVDENAATRTIINAFRHWVKRFHPDQARGLPMEMAVARTQSLTQAKEELLARRRSKKTA